jgi:hypothetical protein
VSLAAAVFPDTTVLSSFAVVRRLELLEGWLRGRGRWVEAVAYEVNRGVAVVPGLAEVVAGGWLGDPIEITDMGAQRAVEHLRRDVFGGRPVEPLKHLGEAQTCYLLRDDRRWQGCWWVSDDRDALRFARAQGLTTRETIDVVAGCVADGDLTAGEAFALMQAMADAGRALRLPRAPADLTR